ncbi:phage tail tape measure protein [Clostridium sp.]|jgi:TP901 family phage tail tape measure protein|uniref:phage tail tape measure protein n=1 Tax=Clostridium sp. TaxID=1506 RepID=UPI0035216627
MAGASIKIGASSSEFQKQMKEVTRQLKLVSSECGVASQKAKLFGTAQDQLAVKQRELTAKIQAQTQMLKLHQDRILSINSTIDKEKEKQSELAKKIEEVSKKYEESIKTTGKNSEETKKLGDELKGLKEEYAKNEKAIESSNNQLVNATTKMNNTEKAMLQNQKALEDINKEIANSKIDKLAESFDKVSEVSGKASDKLKPVSTAIAGLGTASIAASITFEDSMAKVSTIADETEVSYDDMKKSIIDLSNQTGISANEIADNVYNAISAGQSTADAVNFVTESTKLAKSGFAEAGQSLDILTTILNAYGLEASEVTNVSDILVQTQNKGKTTVAELASSMGKIIPTANSVNVNLEQLGTGYALMTSKGIATAETTTYMNSMLNELSDSGSTVAGILKEKTGKSFAELMESGVSLGDAMAILEQEANNSGLAMSELWSSSEAGKAALVLATDAGQAFNSTLSDMQNSAGATDTAFEKVNNTTGNKLKQSLNEVKNSAINMGDTLAPVTSMVAEGFSKITGMLSNLSSEQLKTIAGIGAGVITLNVALGAFSKLTKGISDTVKAYKNIKKVGSDAIETIKNFSTKALDGAKAVGNFALNLGKASVEFAKSAVQAGISATKFIAHKVATMASTLATTAMSAAQAALNLVMSLNPITLIIIGITALVAALVVLWNKCEWFRNLCYSMFEGLKQAWNTTVEFFKSCWDWFTGLWKSAVEGIKNFWNTTCEFFKTIWQGICNTISSIWNSIVNSIKTIWNGFKNIFESVGNAIKSIWNGLTGSISSIWDNVVNGVKSAWDGIISPFKSVVNSITSIWDGIKSMFKLPHFSITGSFSLVPPSIPKVSVDWYYNGGIFKSPTVLNGIGVGDAFNGQGSNAEAIVPLDEMYRKIQEIVKNETRSESSNTIIIKNYMDSEEISSYTYKKVDNKFALAGRSRR